jgi:KipI family sensor histidine kinase inhibitor
VRVVPYGDRALLVELADAAAVVAWVDAISAAPERYELLEDVIAGARTVLLVARPGVAIARLEDVVESGVFGRRDREKPRLDARKPPIQREIEIPVTYDGPDLAEVAELTGLAPQDLVEAHTGTPWRVAFGGFAPGFAYLVGGDARLEVPRRASPRTSVPAGSVGLAGEFSGVYPRASPGGWQLIGRTDAVLWDLDRDPPALLGAGAAVRFVDAGAA